MVDLMMNKEVNMANEWELTDEEIFYVGMDLTQGGGEYADITEVIRASAKV